MRVESESVPVSHLGSISRAAAPGTILEAYVLLFRGRHGVAAISAGVLLFVTGYLIAAFIGFTEEYRTSHQIYLGAFGVSWATWWVTWATRRLRTLCERIQPVFLGPPERFEAEVAWFEKWAFDWPLQTWLSAILWAYGCYDIYDRTRREALHAMGTEWADKPDLLVKNAILAMYDLPIVILFVTSGIGVICYVAFVVRISRLPLVPYLSMARVKLRALTDFAVTTGLAWSVGVCLVVLLFRIEFRAPAVISVLVYTALGLAILIIPECAIHNALERVRHDVLNEALRRLKTAVAAERDPDWRLLLERPPVSTPDRFDEVVKEAISTTTWTYDLGNVSSVLATWLLPLVPLAVNSLIT